MKVSAAEVRGEQCRLWRKECSAGAGKGKCCLGAGKRRRSSAGAGVVGEKKRAGAAVCRWADRWAEGEMKYPPLREEKV